jgi:hypothetical protein
MATRTLLDMQVWCPWSGITIGNEKIKPHKVNLVVCANQTLFSMCTTCRCRSFTSNWTLVARVMNSTTQVKITEKPLVRIRGKANERKNEGK